MPQLKGKKVTVEIIDKFDRLNNIIENQVNKEELYKIEQELHNLNWIILRMLTKKFNL